MGTPEDITIRLIKSHDKLSIAATDLNEQQIAFHQRRRTEPPLRHIASEVFDQIVRPDLLSIHTTECVKSTLCGHREEELPIDCRCCTWAITSLVLIVCAVRSKPPQLFPVRGIKTNDKLIISFREHRIDTSASDGNSGKTLAERHSPEDLRAAVRPFF